METYLKLRRRHQLFVDAYVELGVGGAAASKARIGGKNPRSAACRLLAQPEIRRAVEERSAEAIAAAGITHTQVLLDIAAVIKRCRQAEPVLDSDGNHTGEYRFEARAALSGLELLGKYQKLWTERHEHSGPNGAALSPPVFNISFDDGAPGQ